MATELEAHLHIPDPQYTGEAGTVIEGVPDDVVSAQPVDETHGIAEHERGEAARAYADSRHLIEQPIKAI
jgi:hypothetical protein